MNPAPMNVVCLGVLVADVFLPTLTRLPQAGELVATEDFLVQTGGCAANTAVDLARLGVKASVVGRVGDDVFGNFVRSDLGRRGVDVAGIGKASGLGTSKTVILTVSGEDRRYVHTVGANAAVRAEDLDQVSVNAGDVLYIGGYLVLPGLEPAALAARLAAARHHGARTVLDVVVPAGDGSGLGRLEPVLPHVDFFLPNEDEGRALSGQEQASEQAEFFRRAGAGTVVITRGRHGAVMAAGERTTSLPAPRVEVVEASGAGDAFAAGFIYGLIENWPLERSFAFACVVGASACTALGCSAGVFTPAQAEEYLATNPLRPDRASS